MAQKRHNKYQKKIFMLRTGLIVCLFVLAILGGSAVAKYYSLQKQKGVAVASDFYFSSDILRTGVVLGEDSVPTNISQYVKINGWSEGGGTSTIRFQIQNYQNRLLYNDADIVIYYDVYVMLKEAENNGIKYYLQFGEQTSEITDYTTPTPIYTNQILTGGEMQEHNYNLIYNNDVKTEALPKEVYVWVVPTAPSYMAPTEYMMGAAVSVVAGSTAFSFDGAFNIDLSESDSDLTDADKTLINSQIGLVYNLSTTGIYDKSADKDIVPVRLKWKSKYIEMDRFSEFYQNVTTDSEGWKTIEIDLQAYSSNDIIFYRTKDFSFSEIKSPNDFLGLVQVELR